MCSFNDLLDDLSKKTIFFQLPRLVSCLNENFCVYNFYILFEIIFTFHIISHQIKIKFLIQSIDYYDSSNFSSEINLINSLKRNQLTGGWLCVYIFIITSGRRIVECFEHFVNDHTEKHLQFSDQNTKKKLGCGNWYRRERMSVHDRRRRIGMRVRATFSSSRFVCSSPKAPACD